MTRPEDRRIVAPPAGAAGGRLDRVLADALPDLSRTRVRRLIETGSVSLGRGGTIEEPSYRVKPGQSFAVIVPESADPRPAGESIPLTVVYEDEDLIVVDKKAGLVVHPAPGNPDGTLVNALIAHCGASLSGIGGVRRPGIVHRLDKPTSGLMVAAKNDRSHASLAAQFKARSIDRAYTAFAWGAPARPSGEIEGNIGRSARNRKKMAVLASGGRPAAHPLPHGTALRRGRQPARMPAGDRADPPDPGAPRLARPAGDRRFGLWRRADAGAAARARRRRGGGGGRARAPCAARPPARIPPPGERRSAGLRIGFAE